MSKELTEKIKTGYYYALLYQYDGEHPDDRDFEDIVLYDINGQLTYMGCYDGVQEVMAPVPSYQEYKEMKHDKECLKLLRDKVARLKEQNKTLKERLDDAKMNERWWEDVVVNIKERENKKLEEQLKEANAIITGEIHLVKQKDNEYVFECPEIINYKEKWGVK